VFVFFTLGVSSYSFSCKGGGFFLGVVVVVFFSKSKMWCREVFSDFVVDRRVSSFCIIPLSGSFVRRKDSSLDLLYF